MILAPNGRNCAPRFEPFTNRRASCFASKGTCYDGLFREKVSPALCGGAIVAAAAWPITWEEHMQASTMGLIDRPSYATAVSLFLPGLGTLVSPILR